jgi:hypothetical protein
LDDLKRFDDGQLAERLAAGSKPRDLAAKQKFC